MNLKEIIEESIKVLEFWGEQGLSENRALPNDNLSAVVNYAVQLHKKGLIDPHMLNNLKMIDMNISKSARDRAAIKFGKKLYDKTRHINKRRNYENVRSIGEALLKKILGDKKALKKKNNKKNEHYLTPMPIKHN